MTVEEIRNKALNKRVLVRGVEDKIIAVDDDLLFKMKSCKMFYKKAFIKDIITTKDKDLQSVIDFFKSEESEVVKDEPKEKEPEETIQQSQEKARLQAIEDAEKDFYDNNREVYRICKDALRKNKFDKVPSVFGEIYASAYVEKYEELKNNATIKYAKKYSGVIQETYPGDVDELIAFLKKAITGISVSTSESENEDVDRFVADMNARDNTDYKPTLNQNKQGTAWEARLTNKEKILKDMPKEVYDWKIVKNTGINKHDFGKGAVYNKTNNSLASNPVVLDLLIEYDFKLGENKTTESLEESEDKLKPTIYNVLGLLSRNRQTYREFIDHFKDLEDVEIKDILDWIKNNDKLYVEYKDFFEEE